MTNQSPGTRQKERNIQLDMLRGIAVLLVLLSHLYKVPPDMLTNPVGICLQFLHDIGWLGVDLFFVLSGFLVSGLIFGEYQKYRHFQAGRFLIRRGFKIYPAYYIYFLIGFIIIYSSPRDARTMTYLASIVFFVQNYFAPLANTFTESIFGHFWSLSVEEHFYIGLSILLLLILKLRGNFKPTPLICLCVCTIVPVLRHFASVGHTFDGQFDYDIYTPTHFRIDALTFGVLLSYFHHFHKQQLESIVVGGRMLWLPLSLALVSPCTFWSLKHYFTAVFGLSMLYVGFGIMLLLLLYSKPLPLGPLAKVGFYSYSIYIWHRLLWFIVLGVNAVCPMNYLLNDGIYFVSSIFAGIIMGRLIELPFLAARDAMFPSRSKALDTNNTGKDATTDAAGDTA
jgi:peptidoglycan/LPS O-acetylase OafA/YrhL